jgi:hypothetical protein
VRPHLKFLRLRTDRPRRSKLEKIGEALITIDTPGAKEAAFVAVKVRPHAN